MYGWSGLPRRRTASPSRTVTTQEQVSGQSRGQAPRTFNSAVMDRRYIAVSGGREGVPGSRAGGEWFSGWVLTWVRAVECQPMAEVHRFSRRSRAMPGGFVESIMISGGIDLMTGCVGRHGR
ncbi:hypothetical protein GCM10009677_39960 [Sphaerisporangium rubeum]